MARSQAGGCPRPAPEVNKNSRRLRLNKKDTPPVSFQPENLPAMPVELIQEVKDFLRLDHGEDDAAIAQMLSSAAHLCENFIGQMVIARTVSDRMPVRG